MRILMTTNAAIGHFLPLAPTAAELVARGHEVRVGCPESFARFVAKAGFVAMPCREVDVSVPTPPPPPVEDHEARLRWAVTLSWPDDCRTWVDSLLRKVTRWAPDLVIVEPVEHAGRVVAAALDTPLVVHGWGSRSPQTWKRPPPPKSLTSTSAPRPHPRDRLSSPTSALPRSRRPTSAQRSDTATGLSPDRGTRSPRRRPSTAACSSRSARIRTPPQPH